MRDSEIVEAIHEYFPVSAVGGTMDSARIHIEYEHNRPRGPGCASQIFLERGLQSASTLTGSSGSGMNSALLPSKTPPLEKAEMRKAQARVTVLLANRVENR